MQSNDAIKSPVVTIQLSCKYITIVVTVKSLGLSEELVTLTKNNLNNKMYDGGINVTYD